LFGWYHVAYLLTIAHNNVINILFLAEIRQTFIDTILVSDIQETPLWLSEQARVILDRISFGGSVDNTKHLLEVSLQKLAREAVSNIISCQR
jgi:hypothetical protein